LSRAPDEFPISLDLARTALGMVHPVVVRWRERLRNPSRADVGAWKRAAERVAPQRAASVHWVERDAYGDPARVRTEGNAIVALRFVPAEEMKAFVGAGFPYLAWLRCEPENGDWPEFQRRLESWARGSRIAATARRVHEFRRNDTMGRTLTLFWDEPPRGRHWLRDAREAKPQ